MFELLKKIKMIKRKDVKNVENTNSDSLVSKLSVVSLGELQKMKGFRSILTFQIILGYRIDPFLKELCSNPNVNARRSPAINRGYLARLLALEVTFEKLLLMKQTEQVLSLGAGYDSLYFRLGNCGIMQEMKYFEIGIPTYIYRFSNCFE